MLFTCTLFLSACTSCSEKVSTCGALCADSSIYYNDDSLMEYARRAYLDDDPAALFITGAASYLHAADSAARDSLSVVPLDEADIMLQHACEMGYEEACTFIHELDKQDKWEHYIPE